MPNPDPPHSFPAARPATPAAPPGAPDDAQWIAALYAELRALAQSELDAERPGHTLSATALVNEVYLKFARQAGPDGGPRLPGAPPLEKGIFFGRAAQAMRRILVDHARTRGRIKRGGGQRPAGGDALEGLADPQDSSGTAAINPVVLDEALTRLAVEHQQAARVVELRFFAGLPDRTIAECLNLDERTVRRHWTFAKAWLSREMGPDAGGAPGSP